VPKKAESQMNASEAFRHVMAIAAICKIWQPAQKEISSGAGAFLESPFLVAQLRLPADASTSGRTTAASGNSAADGASAEFSSQESTSGSDQYLLFEERHALQLRHKGPERERRKSGMRLRIE
jgi:hypothetical protein